MRILLNIFLLLFFVSFPTCTNTSAQPKTLFTLSSFEVVATGLQLHTETPVITIQLRQLIYRTSLAEFLAYQFLSLALAASLFHLNTD